MAFTPEFRNGAKAGLTEAQRRYLESSFPYALRLFQEMPVPKVD